MIPDVFLHETKRWVKIPRVWGYPPPDQFSNNYDYYRFVNGQKIPRGCTEPKGIFESLARVAISVFSQSFVTAIIGQDAVTRASGCPGVLLVGEKNDWHNSPIVPLTKEWQIFGASALSWVKYGKTFPQLTDKDQIKDIGQAHAAVNGDRKALCNNGGLNNPDNPRADFVLNENTEKELPVRDKYRIMVTCGVEILRQEKNDHGTNMSVIHSFIFEDGPPPNYDFSRMAEDPRMMVGTIQYYGGGVGAWPQVPGNVFYPFITRKFQPAYYPTWFLQLTTQRNPFYYNG